MRCASRRSPARAELFTTQKGFKTLYEQELDNLAIENAKLTEQVQTLNARVEEYRKKAAGFGGLFSSGGKKADAMYALLLENEALEEALYSPERKAQAGATPTPCKESMRNTGYRRVPDEPVAQRRADQGLRRRNHQRQQAPAGTGDERFGDEGPAKYEVEAALQGQEAALG